ncbi:MAG: hypothetical protein ACI9Y7_002841 [Dokdonia sp.]|jgi:hypothetical protein
MYTNNPFPQTIYKYRDWKDDKHKRVLTFNELFLASPGTFNDPFDCRIPENYHLLDTEEKIDQFIKNMTDKHRDRIISSGYDVEERKENFKERFKDINATQKEHELNEFKKIDECYGVLSLTARWDSLLMWSHYGKDHKGFCIGFNEEKLRNSGLFGTGGMVTYGDSFPTRNPLEDRHPFVDSGLQLNHKASDWSYEQEYRLINLNLEGMTDKERVISISDECITEINLGLRIAEDSKAEITSVARRKKIRLFQLVKVPFQFELSRVEIK